MEIISDFDSKKISFPLPIYQAIKIGEAVSKDGEEFSIFIGMDKEIISQLKALSLDESDLEPKKNTSDRKRFGEGLYEDWYKKNRVPFCLVHKKTNTLAALIWFGPEPLLQDKENWHTAGWRSYPPFRGKGLMKPFSKFVIEIYMQKMPDAKFWIATNKENSGSVGLANFLGFEEFEKIPDSNPDRLVMIKN